MFDCFLQKKNSNFNINLSVEFLQSNLKNMKRVNMYYRPYSLH